MGIRIAANKRSNAFVFIFLLMIPWGVLTQEEVMDFKSGRWLLTDAEIVEHMGRTSLMGTAYLKDVEFENGVIEVDIAVTGARSYPGIVFRMQSPLNYERFYIRPHRAGLYPDALQYTHVINGVASWQLCQGEGFTAGAAIPENQWIHLKMEIFGSQARVYFGDAEHPALVINHLKHGRSKGNIGVLGPKDQTAYFSNFKYRLEDKLKFDPAPMVDTPPGMIMDWQVSQAFKANQVDDEVYPGRQNLQDLEWKKATPEPTGLLDISRYARRTPGGPDVVFAKTTVYSEMEVSKKFLFGYTDEVSVFLDGDILFTGNSAYQSRDPSFLGAVGLFDAVYLPLKRGENELLFIVKETFGGWGLICQDGTAVYQHPGVAKSWETDRDFKIPESIAYDAKRNCLYVSNYDGYNPSNNQGKQYISKVSLDGKVDNLKWAQGLNNPTGVSIYKDKLYAVERANLVEIDTDTGQIHNRYPVPQPGFLNDIAVDGSGLLYISDSRKHIIYRFSGGKIEEWIKGNDIRNPNGLHVYGKKLIVGNNGDNCLKAIDLDNKEISTIVNLGPGIIDGIKTDRDGNYIVSHWEGKVYRISPSGQVKKLLDMTVPEINCADLEFVGEKSLIVIPTFFVNKVMVYELKQE
jgi:sugar lactone lactonase YvrE